MIWREGEQVGPYQIVSQPGQGGMATVYLADHPQLDRQVAIKVMHQTFQADETFVTRFRREAQIVARLEHRHIVPVYDFNEYKGQPYLVMKYLPGMTLKQRMNQGTLPLSEILSVMTAVASALTYAHNKGVLHRDVKPSNIVIDNDNVPYLTDFGLTRIAAAWNEIEVAVGLWKKVTQDETAPEWVKQRADELLKNYSRRIRLHDENADYCWQLENV